MSNLNPIATTKIAAGSTSGVTGNAQALSGSATSGVLAGAGGMANFWDMIIAQFGAGTEIAKTGLQAAASTNTNTTPVTADTTVMPEQTARTASQQMGDNPLALLQLALSSQTTDGQGNIVLDTETTGTVKIQRQLDLTNTIINHLKNMLPENAEKDGIISGVLAKLQAKSDTLQASLSALESGTISKDTPVEDLPMPLMIALGLNPSEITEVTEKIQDLQKKLGREITVEDLIAGVGGIIPPSPQQTVVALKTGADGKTTIDSIDENSQPTDDLAAQLNALDVGAGKGSDAANTAAGDAVKKDETGLRKPGGLPENDGTPANQSQNVKPDTHGQAKKDITAFKENLVNMLNGNKAQQGDMTFPATISGMDADSTIFQPYGYSASPSLSFGTTAQAANMVSSPTVAGQNHPATQMVAATLTKAGQSGEDSTINLRLDPPELGNIAIRLQFGKDKTVKAHVTVEKPETYMMLQREGHSLERALQSAGLDTQGQAIGFELAQDNGAFRHNNQGEGNQNFGGGGKASQDAGGAEEIIQSSMTWQVDSSTGRMRYNILA